MGESYTIIHPFGVLLALFFACAAVSVYILILSLTLENPFLVSLAYRAVECMENLVMVMSKAPPVPSVLMLSLDYQSHKLRVVVDTRPLSHPRGTY